MGDMNFDISMVSWFHTAGYVFRGCILCAQLEFLLDQLVTCFGTLSEDVHVTLMFLSDYFFLCFRVFVSNSVDN